jgi:RNA polymerase sigma-B factor
MLHEAAKGTRHAAPGRHRLDRLGRRMRDGDGRARDELIALYAPLARALALRYRRGSEPADDLVQVALLGLVKAVDRWDPDRGLDLSSYATPTILGELRRHFRDYTWGIRPPRGLQELALAAEPARRALHAELGRPPTVSELAERVGCTEAAISEALRAVTLRVLDSIDVPAGEDSDGASAGELIPCTDRELERADARMTIDRLLAILEPDAREIVRLRFEEDLTQADIAARLGRTQVQISRLLRRVLDQLHAHVAAPVPA